MALNHIIIIEKNATLSVNAKRLQICMNDTSCYFSFDDIAVLYLDFYSIRISNSVLKECGKHNVVVLISDEKHLPSLQALPFAYNNRQAKRAMIQAKHVGDDISKTWWKQIVQARIGTEIHTLHMCGYMNTETLSRYRAEVLPGDTSMVEAKAARLYWNALFGNTFKRHQQGAEDYINSCLNYGYAIIRAAMARGIASYGLIPAFGMGHTRADNPFNLVEYLMEPFRFLIEQYVYEHQEGVFNSKARANMLSIFDTTIIIQGREHRVFSAMEYMIQSYCRVLENTALDIYMPGMIHSYDMEMDEYIVKVG